MAGGTGATKRALLRFDVAVLPADATSVSAVQRLWSNGSFGLAVTTNGAEVTLASRESGKNTGGPSPTGTSNCNLKYMPLADVLSLLRTGPSASP